MSIKIGELMNDKNLRHDLSNKAIVRSKELPDYEVGTKMLIDIMNKIF